MNRLILLVESRIRGDVYVRFGGELPKTHRSNTAGRWMLSLPFESNDGRLKTIVTSYKDKNGVIINKDNLGVRWNGYIMNKFPQETMTTFQGTDIPLARWADVLLMYAEAEVRKTGTVPSVAAINAVNQVRNRAGLANLPAVATNTKDAFLDAILTERGHELFYEGNRKIDLIRFNKYAQEMYKVKGVMPTLPQWDHRKVFGSSSLM